MVERSCFISALIDDACKYVVMEHNSLTQQFTVCAWLLSCYRIWRVLFSPPSFSIPPSIVANIFLILFLWSVFPHSTLYYFIISTCTSRVSLCLFLPHCHLFFWLVQSVSSFSPSLFSPHPLTHTHTHTEGRLEVNMSEVSLEEVERSLLEGEPSMVPGGYWKPKDCLPRWKVSADVTLLQGLFTEKESSTQTDEWRNTTQQLPYRAWGVTEWF